MIFRSEQRRPPLDPADALGLSLFQQCAQPVACTGQPVAPVINIRKLDKFMYEVS